MWHGTTETGFSIKGAAQCWYQQHRYIAYQVYHILWWFPTIASLSIHWNWVQPNSWKAISYLMAVVCYSCNNFSTKYISREHPLPFYCNIIRVRVWGKWFRSLIFMTIMNFIFLDQWNDSTLLHQQHLRGYNRAHIGAPLASINSVH